LVQAYIFTQACSFLQHIVITFPKMTPRTILERRVSRFYTIYDKNQLLNLNTEKVTAFLVLRSLDAVTLGQVVPPGSDAAPAGYWSHNFGKNGRLDLKMSCIDASRRQLQSAREIRV
jgi:hypothetical protein